jgi:hypothetical protein
MRRATARVLLRRDQSTTINQSRMEAATYTFGIRKKFTGFRYTGKVNQVYFPTPEIKPYEN